MSRNSGKQGPMILRLNFFQKLALFAPPLQFFLENLIETLGFETNANFFFAKN
jgi:hypothetical protein